MAVTLADRDHFETLVHRLAAMGSTPIAVYGAGSTAYALRAKMGAHKGLIACLIDDDPAKIGRRWDDLPVVGLEEAVEIGVKGAILTAEEPMQDALWARRARFRAAGIYLLVCPARFKSKTWDDCLIDHYEHAVGKSRGLSPAYVHDDYPTIDAEPERWVLDRLRGALEPGATVLEIGAGAGLWTDALIGEAGAYHIVDFSERLLYEVIEHRFAGYQDRLHLHHDESAKLGGVADASVDLVFSYDVFVHFKSDLVHQFMDEIKRVLRPAGRALIHFATWNPSAIEEWRRSHRPEQAGRHTAMYFNHIDWLRHSARCIGLTVEPVAEEGSRFLARFIHEAG